MPTTSWIQETVEDRFWEGRHAVLAPPPPPVYPCGICGRQFDTADARSWHASEAHPLARPMLYLSDQAAPSEFVIRTQIAEDDVSVGSCTSLRVVLDGHTLEGVAPAALGALVAEPRSGYLVIELENHRAADAADVRATYVIEIAIPDPKELGEVDQAFVHHLAVDRPSTRDVESFATVVDKYGSARPYAGALADYVHGVLVKEASDFGGSTLPFGAFPAKFNRALVELSDHVDRPVAASIVAIARLNLNDLLLPFPGTGDPRVDRCTSTLHATATLGSAPHDDQDAPGLSVIPLCPIDRDTHLVLTAHESLVASGHDSRRIEELEGRTEDGKLSGQDRMKLRVLVAMAHLRNGRHGEAQRHLQVLIHDPIFRPWAERELGGAA